MLTIEKIDPIPWKGAIGHETHIYGGKKIGKIEKPFPKPSIFHGNAVIDLLKLEVFFPAVDLIHEVPAELVGRVDEYGSLIIIVFHDQIKAQRLKAEE